jgi:hypothetical protein
VPEHAVPAPALSKCGDERDTKARDELDDRERRDYARKMEVYAGTADHSFAPVMDILHTLLDTRGIASLGTSFQGWEVGARGLQVLATFLPQLHRGNPSRRSCTGWALFGQHFVLQVLGRGCMLYIQAIRSRAVAALPHTEDRGETNDLADRFPDRMKHMTKLCMECWRSTGSSIRVVRVGGCGVMLLNSSRPRSR